jgi:hypothetical protein
MPLLATTPDQFDGQMYAQLPSVEQAHRALQQRWARFESFAQDASRALSGSGIEHDIGVCLLHRHFAIGPGELMVEEFKQVDEGRALVTAPQPLPQNQAVAPSRWAWVASDAPAFVPLEFSSDPAVARICRRLATRPAVLACLGTLLKQHGLDDILGLSVLRRDGLWAGRHQIYVEDTRQDASVVTVRDHREVNDVSLVGTGWMLKAGTTTANVACFIYCYTWCIAREGHHEQPHTREHDNVRTHVPGERKTPAPTAE